MQDVRTEKKDKNETKNNKPTQTAVVGMTANVVGASKTLV